MIQKLLAKLNRLRLWFGLFRWKNYAWIESVHPGREGMTLVASYPPGGQDLVALTAALWVLYYTVHWKHPRALESFADGKLDSYREAVRHIRYCVRKGIRP